MAKLSNETWEQIRFEREAGLSFGALAKRYGVSKSSIVLRSKLEGWGDGSDVVDELRCRTVEKAVGLSGLSDEEKRAEAIDAVAELAAEVVRRHQAEVEKVRELLWRGVEEHSASKTMEGRRAAFEVLKAAKISSETLTNIQRMERISYGLDHDGPARTEIVIERSYGVAT